MSLSPSTITILISNWPQTQNSASLFKVQAGKTFSYHCHVLVTLHVQFLGSNWLLWQVSSCIKFMQHILRVVCFDSWSRQSFESTCDVFNCLFPLNVQNEIQLLSRVFSYSWLVCLLGFCWEMRRLSKPIIRFRMASILFFTLLDAYENYKGSSDPCLSW